jgi:fatty-acid desaturase
MSVTRSRLAWHNNHHAFPVSPRHGLKWYEIDVNWYGIWILKQLGLASHTSRTTLPARTPLANLSPSIPER